MAAEKRVRLLAGLTGIPGPAWSLWATGRRRRGCARCCRPVRLVQLSRLSAEKRPALALAAVRVLCRWNVHVRLDVGRRRYGAGRRRCTGGGTLIDVRRFFTLGWLGLHAVAIVLATTFVGFGWWQLQRAEGGNMRSWGYTFEWPLFAVFVIVMWVKMMYDELHDDGTNGDEGAGGWPADSDGGLRAPAHVAAHDMLYGEDDPELAAYNRYLARLDDEARRYR